MGELPIEIFLPSTCLSNSPFSVKHSACLGQIFNSALFFQGISLLGFSAIYLLLRRSSHVVFAVFGTIFLPFSELFPLTPLFLVLFAWWIQEMTRKLSASLLPFLGGIFLGLLILLRIDFGGMMSIALLLLLFTYFLLSRKQNISFSLLFSILGKIGLGLLEYCFPLGFFFGNFISFLTFESSNFIPSVWRLPSTSTSSLLETTSLTEGISSFTIDTLLLSETFAWFFGRFHLPSLLDIGSIEDGKRYSRECFCHEHVLGLSTLGAFFSMPVIVRMQDMFFSECFGSAFFLCISVPLSDKNEMFYFSFHSSHFSSSPRNGTSSESVRHSSCRKKTIFIFSYPFPESPQNDNLKKYFFFFRKFQQQNRSMLV